MALVHATVEEKGGGGESPSRTHGFSSPRYEEGARVIPSSRFPQGEGVGSTVPALPVPIVAAKLGAAVAYHRRGALVLVVARGAARAACVVEVPAPR